MPPAQRCKTTAQGQPHRLYAAHRSYNVLHSREAHRYPSALLSLAQQKTYTSWPSRTATHPTIPKSIAYVFLEVRQNADDQLAGITDERIPAHQ